MRIDDQTERRIKEAASIVDVVSDFVQLKRAGAEYTGLCPFHQDRHAGSFMVSPRKNIAHCFPCGKTWNPVDFIMEHEGLDYPDALRWLAQKYGIFIEDSPKFQNIRKSTPRPPMPPPPPKTVRLWPLDWVRRFRADDSDTFIRWLYSLPWDPAQRARLPKVILNYGIGHSQFTDECRDGSRVAHDFTIFWQCDENANLHNGHFMKYHEDGHRVKDKDQYPTTWIHARMKRAKVNPFNEDTEEASYCLFGQHLMAACPEATINIVESEKTAVIMATAYGTPNLNLWMACCGIGNLTNSHRLLQPLIDKGKRIVLYPDKDGVEKWQKAAREIDYRRLTVYTEHLTKWWSEADGPKADIADIILRWIADGQRPAPPMSDKMRAMCEQYPAFATLVEKLGLEEI